MPRMLPRRLSDDGEEGAAVFCDDALGRRSSSLLPLFLSGLFETGLVRARRSFGLLRLFSDRPLPRPASSPAFGRSGSGLGARPPFAGALPLASCSITAAYSRSISRSRCSLSSWSTRSSNGAGAGAAMVEPNVCFVGDGHEKFGEPALFGEEGELSFDDDEVGDGSDCLFGAVFTISRSRLGGPPSAFARSRRPMKAR